MIPAAVDTDDTGCRMNPDELLFHFESFIFEIIFRFTSFVSRNTDQITIKKSNPFILKLHFLPNFDKPQFKTPCDFRFGVLGSYFCTVCKRVMFCTSRILCFGAACSSWEWSDSVVKSWD